MFSWKSSYLLYSQYIFGENINTSTWYSTYTVFSEYAKRTIKYKGSKLWNYLPVAADIKVTKSVQSFKYKFKNLLLATVLDLICLLMTIK